MGAGGSWEEHAAAPSTCTANASPQRSLYQPLLTIWAARAASTGRSTDKEMKGHGG